MATKVMTTPTPLRAAPIAYATPVLKADHPRLNPDFTSLPRTLTVLDRLGLSSPSEIKGQIRKSATPIDISVEAVVILMKECLKGLDNLETQIPGLEKMVRQFNDVMVRDYLFRILWCSERRT